MTTLKEEDKKVFDLLEESKDQFDRFIKISELYHLSLIKKNTIIYHKYSWDTPLDLVWNEGENNAIMESTY